MKNNTKFIRVMAVGCMLLLASLVQAKTITGVVTDQTGETVISASVVVKGTTIGTVTDFDGNYTLEVPDNATTLVFSYIGLQTQEVPITGNVINVVLTENSEVLEEVVVTGYGTTKKRDLVTSVASVSAEQLKDVPVATAAEALQGKLSGVSVTTTEGSPDADVKIRVRGGTSLTQSSDPLYIVDGFPVSSINDIAPGDIASMDVLKDAAATAIYGAQGANGVIIITTKDTKADGDKMQIHLDYSGYMGWRQIAKKYKMMNNEDYLRMAYEYTYLANGGNDDKMLSDFYKYYDPQYNAAAKTHGTLTSVIDYWNQKDCIDWQEETFGGNHLNSNHSISVSGGIKNANFNLSYNRIDDESIMYGSGYNRNNLSLKTKFQPIKDLTIQTSVRYSNTNVLGAGTNSAEDAGSSSEGRLRNATSFVPLEGIEVYLKDLEDDTDLGNIYNPIIAINDSYKKKVDNKLVINGSVRYKFLKHFTVKAELGYENRSVVQDRYYGPTTYYSRAGDGMAGAGASGFGNTISTLDRTSRLKETNTFEYAQKFNGNAHDVSILIGEEQTINKGELRTTYAYGYDPELSGPEVFNLQGLASSLTGPNSANIKNYVDPTDNMLSFFARANYNYMGRYYITGTFRADGSSRFSKGNQWGFFPSVAVAWRMIDEEWMEKAQSWMSNMKFRLSYGSVGNNNVDLGYLHFDYLASPASYMQGMSTILTDGANGTSTQLIAANNNLKWETTITRDFGIDYGFFNERLSGAFDIYWNNTKDLILRYALATGGYNYQYRNIGSTDNKGIEFSIKGVILDYKSKKLSYGLTADANISFNKNTVTDLGGMDSYMISSGCFSSYYGSPYEFKLTKGSAVGDVYGYKTNGWWTASDFASYNKSARTEGWYDENGERIETPLGYAVPGMPKIEKNVDTDGDGVMDGYEMVKLGNTLPVATGGFNLNFYVGGDDWGKVDFTANFTYSIGNDVVNLTALDYSTVCSSTKNRNLLAAYGYGKRYSLFDINGSFMPLDGVVLNGSSVEGDEYARMALRVDEANAGAVKPNPYCTTPVLTDNYVEDASFLRLSSINLGYALASKWTKKAHISTCRFFFSATNLFVVTNYSGLDPEVDTRSKNNPLAVGVDFSAFPKSRSFNFGVNLSFE
ncbi:MAG: TonB-dependent receptor [Paludibacteraceae bacterium]|nr:TonB-dependent receptor [Paludibacteraceae bacterium]